MRRGIILFLVLLVVFLLVAINSVWTLLSLLVVKGTQYAITKAELPAKGAHSAGAGQQIIPKIIHQTYKNESIPAVWRDAQKSCIDLHPSAEGWEYKMWTDEKASAFIAAEYPWFAQTFESYPYPIQRADSIRYFVLMHFGGIYIDLDDGCNRSLEPLLYYPAWVRKTSPTGISNDAMGSVKGHPFFVRVTKELERYNRSWILGYITVMASTGPLFLSVMWRHWSAEGKNVGDGADGGIIRILFQDEYQGKPWSFFTHHLGNSWHGADVEFIFWMSRNWVFVTFIGFVIGGTIIFTIWWAYHRFVLGTPLEIPHWRTLLLRARIPFWRRRPLWKDYELLSRHEV